MTDDPRAGDAWIARRQLPAIGAAALAGLVGLVVSLESWVAVDDAAWRAVLFLRGCSTDAMVERSVTLATRALALLLIAAAVLHVRARGVASAWPWIGPWLLGLLTSKALKHLLTRERPSALPDVTVGYSFPSAHVMNGLLAAVAVVALTRGFRHRGRWWLLAGACTATLVVGRVLLGRHWTTDVVGGILSALVLVGFAVPAFASRPVVAPVMLTAALAAAFALDRSPWVRGVRLPTPLVGRGAALVDVELGSATSTDLRGSWTGAAAEPPFGPFQWLDGEGTLAFDVPATLDPGVPLTLAIGGRPKKRPGSCPLLGVAVNGQPLASFVPFVGWREYRLPLPPALVRAGRNELDLRTGHGTARFGLTYVRLSVGRSTAD